MPLVAPPPASASNERDLYEARQKGKLVAATEERPEAGARQDYVHIATKRRFNTWRDGDNFIEYLADEFGLPQEALTDRRYVRTCNEAFFAVR